MENLKQRISDDYMTAFKARETNRKSILSVVKSAIQNAEKNIGESEMSDQDVMKILNKMVKSLKETIALSGDDESKEQLAVLEEYMPKQMSRDEVRAKIDTLRTENPTLNMGAVMKAFALDAVDKKMVSEVFSEGNAAAEVR
jgi:uncharacterized protein YqeY